MTSSTTSTVQIANLEELAEFARELSLELKSPSLVLLKGDLGTGKTALVKKLLSHYGISENKVKSPTFSLINHFPLKNKYFVHLDLYRLNEPDQFILEEIKEILTNPEAIVLIEWPEKLFSPEKSDWPETFPVVQQIIEINLSFEQKNFRKISICVKNFLKPDTHQ